MRGIRSQGPAPSVRSLVQPRASLTPRTPRTPRPVLFVRLSAAVLLATLAVTAWTQGREIQPPDHLHEAWIPVEGMH